MPNLPVAILFDLDDTIISYRSRRQLLLELLTDEKVRLGPFTPERLATSLESAYRDFWSDEDTNRYWRFRLLEARVLAIEGVFARYRHAALGLTSVFAAKFAERFHRTRETQAACFPNAVETLDALRAMGVRIALVTNGESVAQRAKIERFELAHRFEHIQIEEEVGFGKPLEQAYLHALDTLGVQAHETWMVGDNLEWEVAAPQRCGIFAIWNDHRAEGLPPNSKITPDRIIHSIADLLP